MIALASVLVIFAACAAGTGMYAAALAFWPFDGSYAPHHRERLFGRAAAMFAGLRLADPQLRVLAAAPTRYPTSIGPMNCAP